MYKKWMFMVWVVVLLWSTASGVLGQESGAADGSGVVEESAEGEGTEGSAEESESEPRAAEAGETPGELEEGAGSTREESVFAGAWRLLREQQRHLTGSREDAGLPLTGILALVLVAYVIIVLFVLTIRRRSHTPTFQQEHVEEIQGAGRWLCTITYSIRRKLDAQIELRITEVKPEGTPAELAYLVGGQIKGRLGPGAVAHLDFPGLKPKNFWQRDHQEVIPLGFELIQPRDRAITMHIEGRVVYSVGSHKGIGGELQQVLEFEPAARSDFMGLAPSGLKETSTQPAAPEPVPFGDPQVLPLAAPLSTLPAADLSSSAQLADRAAQTASLAAERALSTLEEFRRRREEIDQRLRVLEAKGKTASGDDEGGGLRHEIKALEERLGSDLRENIKAVMEQVDGLSSAVSNLRSLVSDLAQRVP